MDGYLVTYTQRLKDGRVLEMLKPEAFGRDEMYIPLYTIDEKPIGFFDMVKLPGYSDDRWISANDHLEHYQRKGAEWGVHNGPPYPLDRTGNYSPSEKAEIKKTKTRFEAIDRLLNSDAIRNLKLDYDDVGLDIYASYSKLNSKFADTHSIIDGESSVKRIPEGMRRTIGADMFAVNPSDDDLVGQSDIATSPYGTNCSYCGTAYELRRRGYDVVAGASYGLIDKSDEFEYKGHSPYELIKRFKGATVSSVEELGLIGKDDAETIANTQRYFDQFPPGSRGVFVMAHKNFPNACHVMNWEVSTTKYGNGNGAGDIFFLDGQTQYMTDTYEDTAIHFNPSRCWISRLDDKPVNWDALANRAIVMNARPKFSDMTVAERWQYWLETSNDPLAKAYQNKQVKALLDRHVSDLGDYWDVDDTF